MENGQFSQNVVAVAARLLVQRLQCARPLGLVKVGAILDVLDETHVHVAVERHDGQLLDGVLEKGEMLERVR